MKFWKFLLFFLLISLIIFRYYYIPLKNIDSSNVNVNYYLKNPELKSYLKNLYDISGEGNVYQKSNLLNVTFCPSNSCEKVFLHFLNSSHNSILCALYDLSDRKVINLLNKKASKEDVLIVTDDEKYRNSKYDDYMHDKFCIVDNSLVITGSANPTYNGFFRNNNNIVVINSSYLAKNYEREFYQMFFLHKFGQAKKFSSIYHIVQLNVSLSHKYNYKNGSRKSYEIYSITTCFSPQENCNSKEVNLLNSAKKNIFFALFVITDNDITNSLLKAFHSGIIVKGIIEKSNINVLGSKYNLLKGFVLLDKNKYKMHNKYFIVDNKDLITGSLNPSRNGFYYNDENIIILKGKENSTLINKFINNFCSMVK